MLKASNTFRLRQFNNLLSWVVLGLSIYVFALPLWPQLQWQWQSPAVNQIQADTAPKHQQNTLLIPRLGMETKIHGGDSAAALEKGAWRLPYTSTPDQGSNTVIVGHRFTYSEGPAVFYHLDKVSTGDELLVYWQGAYLTYRVKETKVVAPSEVQVEAPTRKPTLTLYTCTPLWSASQRLVIKAEPV